MHSTRTLLHAATPFQLGKPIAVLTEGLFLYLTGDEKDTLAGNIHDLLALHSGLWISPDVTTKQPVKLFSEAYGTMQEWVLHIAAATGRKIMDDAFEDDNDRDSFLPRPGLPSKNFPTQTFLRICYR
jgi:O-methyltransferase involved in polyketide biosynthesis